MKNDLQLLIATTLRWGVLTACALACVGGALYLLSHGAEPLPDYGHFSYTDPHPAAYTSLSGIWHGLLAMDARSWIQTGVVALILTPIMRVVLSLVDFLREHDWLYAAITSVVLAVILANSLSYE